MNDSDERVRRYLQSRGDVPIPDDLRWPSATDDRRPAVFSSVLRWAALAVAVVVVGVVIRTAWVNVPPGVAGPSSTSPTGPPSSSHAAVDAQFPATVAGMPVVSVAQAVELLDSGGLDGHTIAVAGHFFETFPRCPASFAYIGPLESRCRLVAFTDSAASAALCTHGENSVSCRPPSGTHLAPWFVPETNGVQPRASSRVPVPVVLIGHAGDARQWQCGPDAQEACGRAFVVDRVAWANGQDLPLTAPEPWDRTGSAPLTPRLTGSQVTDALGHGDRTLTAAAFRAGDIWAVDPRWNLTGDDIVWLVRSIGDGGSSSGPTRPVTVSLVDDASAAVLDTHDLALDSAYRPARLWTITTRQGIACCGDPAYPFYRVRSDDGVTIHEGWIGGAVVGRGDTTTNGPDVPLVLDPGTYSITVWLATLERGVIGPPTDECSTDITLNELDDLMIEAQFPAFGQRCAFAPPSPPRLAD